MAEFLCAGWQHNVDKVVDAVRLFFAYALSMAEHKVYLYFQLSNGWHCQFLEPDLKTSLPRKLTFKSAGKLRALIERGHGRSKIADHGGANGGTRKTIDNRILADRGAAAASRLPKLE